MLKKIFWTIFTLVVGVAGLATLGTQMGNVTTDLDNGDYLSLVLSIIMLILMFMPGWFVWKGTKLIPIISNIVVRIMTIIFVIAIAVIGTALSGLGLETVGTTMITVSEILVIVFAMIGIWLKS